MKKPVKIALIVVGVLVAIPMLSIGATAVVNQVANRAEASQITPYGELITVDGKQMNVVVSGSGEETIVLLPGLGTAAPGLDFEPLISELQQSYRVIAIEPFGTGLSDQTDTPRTAENISREVHEALHVLGVDRYVLMGHSISGIYALTYSAAYADELVAFVGIDSSVPDQPGWDDPIPTEALVTLTDLGITRLLTSIAGDPYAGLPYSDEAKRQMALLSAKNGAAPTLVDEMDHAVANFASVSGATFPRTLPVLLFVASGDAEVEGWMQLHEQQATSVDTGRVVPLEGGHYLHHTLAPEIAQGTAAFLGEIAAR